MHLNKHGESTRLETRVTSLRVKMTASDSYILSHWPKNTHAKLARGPSEGEMFRLVRASQIRAKVPS